MIAIGCIDFNYRKCVVFLVRRVETDSSYQDNHMNNKILVAVPTSLIAAAAFLPSFRSSVSVESVIGYASVLALLFVAALEYRITWKRLFGRS